MFKAVIFDLDGTILDSQYDWRRIRENLDLKKYSILDQLYSLPEDKRKKTESLLEMYEKEATSKATLFPGVERVLYSLKESGIKTGLSTNNSFENVSFVLKKYRLEFDAIVTRDDGVWKPRGDPIILLVEKLNVSPSDTLVVGDSDYDIISARNAGAFCAILRKNKVLKEKSDCILESFEDVIQLSTARIKEKG